MVHDLKYDVCDDLLLAGTIGRGIWAITNAAEQSRRRTLTITGDSRRSTNDRIGRDGASASLLNIFVKH